MRTADVVHVADVLADDAYGGKEFARAAHYRASLGVPIMQGGTVLGAIFVGRTVPGLFSPAHVELVRTFAQQAAIAIENARQFQQVGQSLRQQTATNDVLRAISRSAFELGTVLHTLVESAVRLCEADRGTITRQRDGVFYRAESYGFSDDFMRRVENLPIVPDRGSGTARALLEGRVVHIVDVMADPEYTFDEARRTGEFRSMVAMPMMREGVAVGVIALTRDHVRPFADDQIALLQTFADQAVIAIENVRLFTELEARNRDLTEALEQQTATSDILRVISRSQTDAQPVFDTIAKSVLALCQAQFANVFTYDGENIHLAAYVNVYPEYIDVLRKFYPRRPGRATAVARAIETGTVCTISDVLDDSDYMIANASAVGGFRSVIAVPLLRDGKPIGGIAVGRPDPGTFPDTQVTLLQTFADQAVIAIENVRLFTELEARTAQLTRSVNELRALGEVGAAVSSTLDLGTVLSTIVSRATELTGMDAGSIYEYDDAKAEFFLHSAEGLPPEILDALRATPMRQGEGALGRTALTRQPVEIADVGDETVYQSHVRDLLVERGFRALLVVPLLREDHLLGGLAVNRRTPGPFDPQVIALLETFATQSAIAIHNARLFREIESKSCELETASRHKSEFLANMSHELRTPLNAIIGFSEVLTERLFGELNGRQAEYIADIADSGRHLLALINDILDLSKIEAGRMELDVSDFDLAKSVAQTLSLVRERAERRNIVLDATIDDAAGIVHADQRKVKQVLLNLLSNALKFTPEGGKVEVRVRRFADRVEVAVEDTGVGIAPEDLDAVFEEFRQVGASAARIEGTGLGLAISRKFIELHGGGIFVQSEVGKGSTFTLSLPIGRPQVTVSSSR